MSWPPSFGWSCRPLPRHQCDALRNLGEPCMERVNTLCLSSNGQMLWAKWFKQAVWARAQQSSCCSQMILSPWSAELFPTWFHHRYLTSVTSLGSNKCIRLKCSTAALLVRRSHSPDITALDSAHALADFYLFFKSLTQVCRPIAYIINIAQ